jgi:hypothetical protein
MLAEFFGDSPRIEPGGIGPNETWWVERQQALEQAGYMLRPRYRPGWKPPWAGTKKFYDNFEDGQLLMVRGDTSLLWSPCSWHFRNACASMQLASLMGDRSC